MKFLLVPLVLAGLYPWLFAIPLLYAIAYNYRKLQEDKEAK